GPWRGGMARTADQAGNASVVGVGKEEEAVVGVATGKIGRISAVQVLVRIRLVGDGVDEVGVGRHVVAGQRGRTQKGRKGDVKVSKIGAITPPMERVKRVQATQRLRHHRSLHWMK